MKTLVANFATDLDKTQDTFKNKGLSKMRKLLLAFLMGLLLLAPLSPAHPHTVNGVDNHNVEIPDTVLRGIIEDRLNKAAGAAITANEIV